MSVKIELGFTEAGVGAPFFTIGNATKGVIGSTTYVIGGGELFVDVTNQLQSFAIIRGKSRELDKFNAGQLTATFTNNNRFFDPTYEPSPYYGQIVPKRSVRVSVDGIYQFYGVTDDWNISYDPSGVSVASLTAFDSFSIIANNVFESFAPDEELSGARVTAVLDNISWPLDLRDIDTGSELLEAQIVADGANALDYLNVVEQSEVGFIFMDKIGKVRFIARNDSYALSAVTFSDNGIDIPYTDIAVTYGSEFLYNEVTLTSSAGTAMAEDAISKATYGPSEYTLNTYLATIEDLQKIANGLLSRYKNPEFRFERIQVNLDAISSSQRASLLALELGDLIEVEFTPSGIPPQISRFGRVISIGQSHSPTESVMTIGLASIEGTPFIIGSSTFGIIGVSVIGF